jgi:DNA polymerase-1
MRMTPCCRAMCWKCTSRMAWPAWPSATLGRSGISYEDLCGKGAHQIPFAQVPVDKAAAYSCEDSDQTLDVHLALWPLLQADEKLRFIYELEIASSEALYRIERNGVLIDAPTLAQQSHELGQRILQLETEAYEIAGQPFNLSSPKQLGEIFFDKLGMPVVKKTATARAAPTRRCWKSWPRTTRYPPNCWSTAA